MPQGQPLPLPRLVGRIAAARQDYCARYARLGQVLPGLVASATATRTASSGQAREQADMAPARTYGPAAGLAAEQLWDAAWMAADRAPAAGRRSSIPVVVGGATRQRATAMRRSGRPTAAVHLLSEEAAARTLPVPAPGPWVRRADRRLLGSNRREPDNGPVAAGARRGSEGATHGSKREPAQWVVISPTNVPRI
ncbi:hypothetical protein [Streptomyces sp. NPDC001297]|uniref:hypothetical protein n=1 Tax=Streptomyces sp. NPDC001297 TaxID=3364559 RepID=UPI0036CDCDFC